MVDKILRAKYCGDLYENDPVSAKARYRFLSKMFHPDVNKGPLAKEAFIIVSTLYAQAEKHFEKGTWEESFTVHLETETGNKIRISPSYTLPFELGTAYFTKEKVVFQIAKEHKKFADNYVNNVLRITYPDPEIRKEFERYFPKGMESRKLSNGDFLITMNKTKDVVPLKQILEVEGVIPIEHLAWIISRLLNIACHFHSDGRVSNGFSVNTCLLSPEFHTVLFLGGWWYSTGIGQPMIGTEKKIYDVMSVTTKGDKKSSPYTDIESIKMIAREIKTDRMPKEIQNWMFSGSSTNIYKEFEQWGKVLEKVFGKRTFVTWGNINLDKYYL
jgi:hypothetical protein